jgi:hypothetical protein
MKKNKRRIKTFKNWLLARDSASRVSTKPTYLGFFSESLEDKPVDKYQIMELFDAISDSTPFKRLENFSGANLGSTKMAKGMDDSVFWVDKLTLSYPNMARFFIFLKPKHSKDFYTGKKRVLIRPTQGDYSIENDLPTGQINVNIPLSYKNDKKKIDETVKDFARLALEGLTEEGTYQYRFLNWWLENLVFKGDKWESTSLLFENALVEWMKNADSEDAKQAYVDFFSDKKGKKEAMERSRYYLNYDDIVNTVKENIKKSGINLDGVDRGSSLLSRFDS